jgi:hypothetical protein
MSLDQRLRDELSRSAGEVRTDTDVLLGDVIRGARHRVRTRRGVVASLAVALIALGAVGIPQLDIQGRSNLPASTPSAPKSVDAAGAPTGHERLTSAITGEWLSKPTSSARVRAAIRAAGLNDDAAKAALGDAQQWQVRMTFTYAVGGGRGVLISAWDPSRNAVPTEPPEQAYYRLAGQHTLVISTSDPVGPVKLSYEVRGGQLFLGFQEASRSLSERATASVVAWTAAPLRKMQY